MNTKWLAFVLLVLTAGVVALYPSIQPCCGGGGGGEPPPPNPPPNQQPDPKITTEQKPRVEAVFVLDTTGSMSGLIQAAKEKIWSIASTMAAAQPAPEIRLGLVAYRDRGDDYVTRRVDLSKDLDSVYATLMEFQAQGGGDGPGSGNQALREAVENLSWSQDPNTYRVIFLVGDAPPHMDYQDDVPWSSTLVRAKELGIHVNAVQCGSNSTTKTVWQQIAQAGNGRYFQVDQGGSALAVTTPYDKRLADLAAKLDKTRLYYGSEEEKAKKARKVEAAEKLHETASSAAQARRAAFNLSESGKANLFGEGELVEDVASGRVDLEAIPAPALPPALQSLSKEEQAAKIRETAEQRAALEAEMKRLAKEREAYLRRKVEKMDGVEESLDHSIYRAVRKQASEAGLRYEADAPAY